MELIAAGGALGAKSAFDYNRENFLYDRRLRRRKNFKVMEYRIAQASLWREDIRDLCSLTEYKMHVYLLVNILLLGHTVVLWCQGKLPHKTPPWLMAGYSIATAGACMFLLLSIWMAMHAAVAAQSYEVRMLTQLVRLPIPSWNEVEACRTFASEFEQIESKQMFRIPFAMGPQESLVAQPPPAPLPPEAEEAEGSGLGAAAEPAAATDPWGLEGADNREEELGCKYGQSVASLRHVKLARQAMVHWQSYDAFARISMSVGVDQLLLAMSYYILGYMLVEVGCRSAGTYGVILLTVLSETLLRLDMSLTNVELHLLQALLAVGPICCTLACLQWSKEAANMRIAEGLLVVGFLSHGVFIIVLTHLARVDTVGLGVLLPRAFHSVLYLDVFGDVNPVADDSPSASGAGTWPSAAPGAGREDQEEIVDASAAFAQDGAAAPPQRGPTAGTVRYDEAGKPMPVRPGDYAPDNFVEDLRDLPGAPQIGDRRLLGDAEDVTFYSGGSWLGKPSSGQGAVEDDATAPIVTGHEGNAPRLLPWQTFTMAMRTLSFAWLFAAGYFGLSVALGDKFLPVAKYQTSLAGSHHSAAHASLLGIGASSLYRRGGLYDVELQELNVSWLFSDVEPRSLACDAAGSHFVASDGLLMFAARLPDEIHHSDSRDAVVPQLAFAEVQCGQIEGEGVQDAAVACVASEAEDRVCEALVLHGHGRRVAACQLSETATEGEGFSANVSDAWLNRLRDAGVSSSPRLGAATPHTRVEKVVSVASEPDCGGECSTLSEQWKQCTLLGTTHSRVVQMRENQLRGEMIPSEVLSSGAGLPKARPGHARPLDARRLGVLQADGHAIQVLDNSGTHIAALGLPEDIRAAGFCAGGGYVYFLGPGPSPTIWRTPLPPE